MDAPRDRVLHAGGPARKGNARLADLLPRLDGRRQVDVELVCRCDDPRPGSWGNPGVRRDRGRNPLRIQRRWRASRALDPEHRHAAPQAALDVRVRAEGNQCVAAGLRRSFLLELDPTAALGVPTASPFGGWYARATERAGRRGLAGVAAP